MCVFLSASSRRITFVLNKTKWLEKTFFNQKYNKHLALPYRNVLTPTVCSGSLHVGTYYVLTHAPVSAHAVDIFDIHSLVKRDKEVYLRMVLFDAFTGEPSAELVAMDEH